MAAVAKRTVTDWQLKPALGLAPLDEGRSRHELAEIAAAAREEGLTRLAKFLAGTMLAILVFLVGAFFQVRGALPAYSGHVEGRGLKAPVEILRDKNAVPHIIAGSLEDAAFGLGYVHAQDRFWQMELMRRLGQGRLSEIVPPRLVGSGLIDTDRTMRGLGIYRKAADSVNALDAAFLPSVRSLNTWLPVVLKKP